MALVRSRSQNSSGIRPIFPRKCTGVKGVIAGVAPVDPCLCAPHRPSRRADPYLIILAVGRAVVRASATRATLEAWNATPASAVEARLATKVRFYGVDLTHNTARAVYDTPTFTPTGEPNSGELRRIGLSRFGSCYRSHGPPVDHQHGRLHALAPNRFKDFWRD
jgi:hypothetical protein